MAYYIGARLICDPTKWGRMLRSTAAKYQNTEARSERDWLG